MAYTAEVVVYDGITYRRYPDSPRRTDRVYFTPAGGRKRGKLRLHEQIWTDKHGPIPHGYHVHHADHEPLNNEPGNLECIPRADHHRHHVTDPARAEQLRQHADDMRPLASAWHGSEAGRAWHAEHGRRVAAGRTPKACTCEHCGAAYESVHPGRFCSPRCKQAARRARLRSA